MDFLPYSDALVLPFRPMAMGALQNMMVFSRYIICTLWILPWGNFYFGNLVALRARMQSIDRFAVYICCPVAPSEEVAMATKGGFL